MRICIVVLTVTAALVLTACSPSSPPSAAASSTDGSQVASSSTRLKTPWDSLLKDRDKAKAVQQKVNDYAKRQQQAIEKQSQ